MFIPFELKGEIGEKVDRLADLWDSTPIDIMVHFIYNHYPFKDWLDEEIETTLEDQEEDYEREG